MLQKSWGLMKPGLQMTCLLCPCTSSAVVPLPDATDLIRLYLAHVPCVCLQCVLWHEEAGSPVGSYARVWLPQLTASLREQLGSHLAAVVARRVDVQAAAAHCAPRRGLRPSEVQGGCHFLPLRWL